MRNLWAVMKEFSVLPTNEDFRALSDNQLDLIIFSMLEDNRQMDMARRGVKEDGNYFDDSFEEEVWNKAPDEWDVLKDGHDADEIARQVEALTREEDKRNLMSKFDSIEDYNKFRESGGQTSRESEISDYIDRQIAAAREKAKMIEAAKSGGSEKVLVDDKALAGEKSAEPGLNKKAMEDAIKLFNSDDDDDFTAL